jgi:hypothetical protein
MSRIGRARPAKYFALRHLGRATPLFGQMSRFCVARTLPSTGPELLRRVLRGCSWVFLPEGFAVLGVEVNGPQPFGRPVRPQTATYTARLSNRSPPGAVPVSWIREMDTRSSAYTHRPSWWKVSPKDPASARQYSCQEARHHPARGDPQGHPQCAYRDDDWDLNLAGNACGGDRTCP